MFLRYIEGERRPAKGAATATRTKCELISIQNNEHSAMRRRAMPNMRTSSYHCASLCEVVLHQGDLYFESYIYNDRIEPLVHRMHISGERLRRKRSRLHAFTRTQHHTPRTKHTDPKPRPPLCLAFAFWAQKRQAPWPVHPTQCVSACVPIRPFMLRSSLVTRKADPEIWAEQQRGAGLVQPNRGRGDQ